jgi:hypothetical protein
VQTAAPGAAYGAPACPRCADIEPVLRAHVEHVLALAALMAEAARLRRDGRVREARRQRILEPSALPRSGMAGCETVYDCCCRRKKSMSDSARLR